MNNTRQSRRGQALLEFAIVALVLYLLIGGAITFGLWIYAGGQIQQAANVGARELSQTPLPALMEFETALDEDVVRQRVYDDRWLVIDLDQLEQENPNYNFFTDVVPRMPLLNQQLAPLYILDTCPDANTDITRRLIRFPGALLNRTDSTDSLVDIDENWVADEFLVQIPLVVSRAPGINGGGGAERIRWLDVVEEIDTEVGGDDGGVNPDPFSLDDATDDVPAGVVALRVHYPAQSTWLSSYRDRGQFVFNAGDPNVADDDGVVPVDAGDLRGSLINEKTLLTINGNNESVYAGTYGGKYGLGVHGAMTSGIQTGDAIGIRPYRRVLVSHAIFRREAYSVPTP